MESVELPTKSGYTMTEDVKVVASESIRFDLSDPEQEAVMLQHLEEHGYAVVANVANEEQIELGKNMFWEFWEKTQLRGPIKRDDVHTWKHWMANSATGILATSRGANHNEFSWNTRTLPAVKNAFAKIWHDDDLVVSFDASGAFRPWAQNKEWLTNGGWWHVDQNHTRGVHRQGKVTIQGLVTYYDATPETGGLCVIPGSHKHHQAVCERAPMAKMKIDYVQLAKTDPVLTSQQAILVCAKAGDLVLWDSRTVHCNTPALSQVNYFSDILKESALLLQMQNEQQERDKVGVSEAKTVICTATRVSTNTATTVNTINTTTDNITPADTTTPITTPATIITPVTDTTNTHASTHINTLTTNTIPFTPPPELLRLVSYVCMVPRTHTTSTTLYNRKQAFLHRLPTSHYPVLDDAVCTDSVVAWTKRRDILTLVGYTEREIDNIQVGKDPSGWSCVIS